MRRSVVLCALLVMSQCAAFALAQEKPKTAKKGVEITSPATAKKKAAYKEWAKAIREAQESAKKIPDTQPGKREALAEKMLRDKEAKIRAKYRVSAIQLTLALKEGLLAKWPTESPKDLKYAQAILDPLILKDEIREWDIKHSPTGGAPMVLSGARAATDYYQTAGGKAPVAPITICKAKSPAGEVCSRKTVGKPGTKCYEHRQPAENSD
jgi:hypothetical protein